MVVTDTLINANSPLRERLFEALKWAEEKVPNEGYLGGDEAREFYFRLGFDLNNTPNDGDWIEENEWFVSNIEQLEDNTYKFKLGMNEDFFLLEDFWQILWKIGVREMIQNLPWDEGDCISVYGDENKSKVIYSTGDNEEIDQMFIDDECFEGGEIEQYYKMYKEGFI
jgi:hypothetical protein